VKTNKAVATPEYIGDVMNGRRDEIPLRDLPDDRFPLALWVDDGRRASCLLEIVDCWYDGDGYTVKVRPWTYQEEQRWLRAGSPLLGGGKARLMSPRKVQHRDIRAKDPAERDWTEDAARGYTDRAGLALHDAGEAVPEHYQDHLTMSALRRHVKRRRKDSLAAQRDRELQGVLDRIDAAMDAAKANHIDVRDDLRAVRRMHAQGRDTAAMVLLRETERRAHRDELRDAA
jgi:hypothetical protein